MSPGGRGTARGPSAFRTVETQPACGASNGRGRSRRRLMTWRHALLLGILTACRTTPSAVRAIVAPRATDSTAGQLQSDLFAFAADSFRGRETGSRDADRAAALLARRLR